MKRFEALRQERQPFEPVWEDVADFMGAEYQGFASVSSSSALKRKRPERLDATARRAANIFSAGMLSGASSPSQRWFSLSLEDDDLAGHPAARGWLQDVEDLFCSIFAQRGYYREQTLGYHQSGLFGWQCLYVDETPEAGIRFRALPLSEVYVAENHQGEVDTVFRSFRLSARQAVQKWGADALSQPVRNAANDPGRADQKFDFVHAVFPRPESERRAGVDGGMLAYASFYIEQNGPHTVHEGGYEELPYIVTRYSRLPNTPYSTSPGTEALADTKMLNEMKRLILEAGQLAVAPPYLVPDDGFIGRFSFEPRAMNYYRRAEGNSLADFGPLSVGGDPRFSWELMNATKQDINEAFFVDLFLTIRSRIQQGASPTAHEVAQLAQERMFLLGPMLVNQQTENFDRLFDRLFNLLLRRGELPPVPRELAGQQLKAEYVSPLMLAQKEGQTQAVLQTYQDAGLIAQAAPEVLDNFEHDENLRRVAEQRGFPQKGLRSPDEVARLRQARAEAQERQAQMEMAAQDIRDAAGAAPGLAKAPEEGSPMQKLLSGLEGGA
jgi:hypothetical protein